MLTCDATWHSLLYISWNLSIHPALRGCYQYNITKELKQWLLDLWPSSSDLTQPSLRLTVVWLGGSAWVVNTPALPPCTLAASLACGQKPVLACYQPPPSFTDTSPTSSLTLSLNFQIRLLFFFKSLRYKLTRLSSDSREIVYHEM